MDGPFYVYILTNRRWGRLYHGSTRDLGERIPEHRRGDGSRHAKKYNLFRLVWFIAVDTLDEALWLEHKLKRWHRAWKIELIDDLNPDWRDLFDEFISGDLTHVRQSDEQLRKLWGGF